MGHAKRNPYSVAMPRPTLRAVAQLGGGYRVSVDPPRPELSSSTIRTRAEVERLAEEMDAELRWVEGASRTRGQRRRDRPPSVSDPWGGSLPPSADDD